MRIFCHSCLCAWSMLVMIVMDNPLRNFQCDWFIEICNPIQMFGVLLGRWIFDMIHSINVASSTFVPYPVQSCIQDAYYYAMQSHYTTPSTYISSRGKEYVLIDNMCRFFVFYHSTYSQGVCFFTTVHIRRLPSIFLHVAKNMFWLTTCATFLCSTTVHIHKVCVLGLLYREQNKNQLLI